MKQLQFLLAATLLALPLPAAVPAFKSGDRIAFIGDSITHGGSYHPNIYLFYATRFPTQPFDCYNCGISGDTTPGTNQRFESDIAIHKPNVATIMLGMNDAWAWTFTNGEPTEAMLKGREQAYQTHTSELEKLATSLENIGCRMIFIKPSIYDQTAKLDAWNCIGKNDELARFGNFQESLAKKHNASVVDFHTPMADLNARLQKGNPSATIISADRIHPGDAGQFVMTYHFLKSQEMPRIVSAIELDAESATITRQENCQFAEKPAIAPDRITFICTENALPFPVTEGQSKALEWVPFQQELNQQSLKITHLKQGSYDLSIDDIKVATFTSDQLASGVNLSDNHSTPQYQQALEVKALNDERLAVTSKLRSLAHVRHTMLSKITPPVPESDLNALQTALDAHVEKSKGESWYGYLKIQVSAFLAALPHEQELKTSEARLMNKLWTINQPKSHHWTITPAPQP